MMAGSPAVKTAALVCMTLLAQLAWAVPASVLADSKQATAASSADGTKDIVKRSSSPASGEPVDPVEEPTMPLTSVWNRNADDGSVQVRPAPQKRGAATQRNPNINTPSVNIYGGRPYDSLGYEDAVLPSMQELTAEDYYANRYPDGEWANGPIDVTPANAYNLYQMLRANNDQDEERRGSWNTEADVFGEQRKLQQQLQQQQRAYENLQSVLSTYDDPMAYTSSAPAYFNPRAYAGPGSDRKKRSAAGGRGKSAVNMRSKREAYLTPAELAQLLAMADGTDHRRFPRVQHPLMDSREELMMYDPLIGRYSAQNVGNPINVDNSLDDLNDDEQWMRTPVSRPSYHMESELVPAVYRQPSPYPSLAQRLQVDERLLGPELLRAPRGGFDTRLMEKPDAFEKGSRKYHSMKLV